MSERRPHWDDELIFAVMSAAGDGGHLFIDDIHAVIAAVEDWQVEQAAPGVSVAELLSAWAAIAGVRALCSQSRAVVSRGCSCHADECSGKCGAGKPLAWDLDPADVLRALDGAE